MRRHRFAALATLVAISCSLKQPATASAGAPPFPVGPLPSARQRAWQDLEFCAFVHFNMDTFTDAEWGTGSENPDLFQPSELDCRQWARVCKDAGMKGVIVTAKHHDGFCLWPSKLTAHGVASSSWRGGKGDVIQELANACSEFGLELGIYVSPWDRNCPLYGDSPRYNEYFKGQLAELLTNYGDIFGVWFDGACGEGPNGKKQIYDWPGYVAQVRAHQPKAVIFSDAGPDVRWVGNEDGFAGETCWSTLRRDEFYPGIPDPKGLTTGQADGSHWVPAECDVSIRPGWYYHRAQDDQVKSLARLLDIYECSIGRNASLLLNLPVDRRGLVHENDAARLLELRKALDETYSRDLARGAAASADRVRGNDPQFGANRVVDGDSSTYWAVDDEYTRGSVVLELPTLVSFDRVQLREAVDLGQRVQRFTVDAWTRGDWQCIAEGTTIGRRRILRVPRIESQRVRVTIQEAKACPTLAEFALFSTPASLDRK